MGDIYEIISYFALSFQYNADIAIYSQKILKILKNSKPGVRWVSPVVGLEFPFPEIVEEGLEPEPEMGSGDEVSSTTTSGSSSMTFSIRVVMTNLQTNPKLKIYVSNDLISI